MAAPVAAFIILISFLTATLSGIFGMAGGLVLMGALALVLPVSAAFVTHGLLQLVANGWRAVLHREHIDWRIIANYALATAAAGAAVAAIAFAPSKPLLYLLMGLVPMLVWMPKDWLQLDASKTPHALASGFLVTLVNLTAGVAGPLLDIFFVRTALTRHQIVATKAATQVFSHAAKILVYGAPLLAAAGEGMPPWWVFALAIPASMLGTALGGKVLDRMNDVDFKRWTAWIVTAIGVLYLVRAAQLWAG
jgi:uncharacterized protein